MLYLSHIVCLKAAYLSDRVLVMAGGTIVGEVRPGLDRSLKPGEQRSSSAFLTAVDQISRLMQGAV